MTSSTCYSTLLNLLMLSTIPSGSSRASRCQEGEFQCKNENRNQILTINDFNKETEKCIPNQFRCDGRHDCQDGSDEYDCDFSNMAVNREFLCYKGRDQSHQLTDCIKDDTNHPPHTALTLSVSESLEWVCTKTVFNNGTISRGCEKTYTGGETIAICFWSDNNDTPKKCLCSRQQCNSAPPDLLSPDFFSLVTLYIVQSCW